MPAGAPSESLPRAVPIDHTDPDHGQRVRTRINHHWTMLGICIAIVILSFALQVRPDQRVEFRWLTGYPLPETCMSRSAFDVPCPGCGLTRSFISMAEGNWSLAFQLNRTGWLLAIAVLVQFPYRLQQIRHLESHGLPERGWKSAKTLFSWVLIAALVSNWTLQLFGI